MSNKTYDILAYIQRIFLPALAVLIVTLGEIWGFESEALLISGTVEAVAYFMGRLLRISSKQYFEEMAEFNVPDEEQEDEEEAQG